MWRLGKYFLFSINSGKKGDRKKETRIEKEKEKISRIRLRTRWIEKIDDEKTYDITSTHFFLFWLNAILSLYYKSAFMSYIYIFKVYSFS